MVMQGAARRPLKTRQAGWAQDLARSISRTEITPNAISLLSIFFAAAAGALLWATGVSFGPLRMILLVGAALAIQARLLCNLLDGMVAVEGGKKSATGDLFNEVPDRIADLLILVSAGYALHGRAFAHELGWLAGALAVLTAYLRLLGGALGFAQDFRGPMSKPQRMAVLTGACLLSIFEPYSTSQGTMLEMALLLIAAGSAWTCIRRLKRIAQELQAR